MSENTARTGNGQQSGSQKLTDPFDRRPFYGPWKPQQDFPTSDERSMDVARRFLEQGLAEGEYLLPAADEFVEVFSGPLGNRWGGAVLVLTTDGHTLLVDTGQWGHSPGATLDWADHYLTDGW